MEKIEPIIGIILLAAGSSSRMGRSKQLLTIEQEPLLLKTCKAALQSNARNSVIVVLGANEQEHRALIRPLPITIVHNNDWPKGMGSSIKAGLRHLTNILPSPDAVIIMVCDQPLLTSIIINSLIKSYHETKKGIIASGYGGTTGVPVLFDKYYFGSLMKLEDHEGAKKLIQQHAQDVFAVDFQGGEIDLDTMDDYNKFKARSE